MMGSLHGETMAVRHHVIYHPPGNPGNPIAARRRDVDEKVTSHRVNGGTRPSYLVGGGVEGGTPRQRSSSSSQGLVAPSPSPGAGLRPTGVRGQTASVATGIDHGLKVRRNVNGWAQTQHSDVFAFASDTEASPTSHR